jgi:hypothetical protein
MKMWQELELPSQKHMDALILVRDRLRDGTLVHIPGDDDREEVETPSAGKTAFNMSVWLREPKLGENCGTVACIGGWTVALCPGLFTALSPTTRKLFHPPTIDYEQWGDITPTQAADAIDRFLEGQEPWPSP